MRCRRALLLLAAAPIAASCTDAPTPLPAEPEAAPLTAAVSVPEMTRSTLVVEHALREPCTASLVDLSGSLQLQRLARVLDAHRREIRYSAEPTSVRGLARSGDAAFRVEGAASGVLTAAHGERAVTAADFQVVVTSSPGVEPGRAQVAPRVGVLIAFPVDADAEPEDPVIDGVFFAKGECGELP